VGLKKLVKRVGSDVKKAAKKVGHEADVAGKDIRKAAKKVAGKKKAG
jgi:predicted small secreted protein